MSNEPVAWMQTLGNRFHEIRKTLSFDRIGENDIPLYTAEQLHPAKTLTDEELEREFYKATTKNGGIQFETMSMPEFIATVRAILRKAQDE